MVAFGIADVSPGLAIAVVVACLSAYALGNRLGDRWSEQAYRKALTAFLIIMVAALVLRAQ